MSSYTTGELARLCGVSVRTVQYYDARGILSPTDLSEGGRRIYSEEDLSQMKIICFLRELGLSLDNITKLLGEENSKEVISLILEEQRLRLEEELGETQEKLDRMKALCQELEHTEEVSVKSIGDVAHIMENKKTMRRLHTVLLATGIPMALLEVGSIILWIVTGIWWPFAIYAAVMLPYAVWISRYYFSRVAYICPECHEIFIPSFKQAFWANHTPGTRKLTCTKCGHRGYCVETYRNPEAK